MSTLVVVLLAEVLDPDLEHWQAGRNPVVKGVPDSFVHPDKMAGNHTLVGSEVSLCLKAINDGEV